MSLKILFLFTSIATIILGSIGCAVQPALPSPTVVLPPIPSSTPTILESTATLTPMTTSTHPASNLLPVESTTPAARVVDMRLASLRLEDFPPGFQPLDKNDQEQIGFTPDLLARLFEGTFRQATAANSFAFRNAPEKTFEVVIGVVFYPLTPPEQAELDHILADPQTAMRNFSQGFGGQAQLLAELSQMGQVSVGWSFLSGKGSSQLKGEMVIFRRSEAAAILMALYPFNRGAPAGLTDLAPRLDRRIRQGLGE